MKSAHQEITYASVSDRDSRLDAPIVQQLLAEMPESVRNQFISQFQSPTRTDTMEVLHWFEERSEISRLASACPGSALPFEHLYNLKHQSAVDAYFLKSPAGHQIYERLCSIQTRLPEWIQSVSCNGHQICVDNIGSGPGRDMIGILAAHPNLRERVRVRCVDTDTTALEIGRKVARKRGLADCFSYQPVSMTDVEPLPADFILLIGILCPLPLQTCRAILKQVRRLLKPRGIIVFSTALVKMVYDDPVTDFIMRLHGWNMCYKTEAESVALASSTGWNVIGTFFDEPLHHHCMVVARRS